jgi:hypothetical protein
MIARASQEINPDDEIRRALSIFMAPGQPISVQTFEPRPAEAVNCSSLDDAVAAAIRLDEDGRQGTYFTPNSLRPDFIEERGKGAFPEDDDMDRRLCLLIDADAKRPAKTNANKTERQASERVIGRARDVLENVGADEAGLIGAVEADSGNGSHGVYWIDLPNDEDSKVLLKLILDGLDERCSDQITAADKALLRKKEFLPEAKAVIDTTCYDAKRLWPVYGTMKRKGPPSPERPHRQTLVISGEPWDAETATHNTEVLRELAKRWEAPRPKKQKKSSLVAKSGANGRDAYIQAAIDAELKNIAGACSGERNAQLFKSSAAIGNYVGAGAITYQEAFSAIQAAAEQAGCDNPTKDNSTIRRGLDAGKQNPRDLADIGQNGKAEGSSVSYVSRRTKKPQKLPAYQPFPLTALPPVLRDYVDASARAIGCDPAQVALPALAVMGACIGNSRALQVKKGWTEPPVIWATLISDSGKQKSPAHDAAVDPLNQIQMDLVDKYNDELAVYEESYRQWKDKPKDQRGPEPTKPASNPEYMTNDATIENVGELLRDNPRGLLLARDELDGWFQSFTRYKKGGGTDRPYWLELSRAGTLRLHRLGREKGALSVRRACCSVCGTIQPVILARALDDEAMAAGLGARFLMAMPPGRKRVWTEAEVDEKLAGQYAQLIKNLLALELKDNTKRSPHVLFFDSRAKSIWVDWFNSWGERMSASEGEQAASMSKLEGYALRLALIHHVITHVNETAGNLSSVGKESILAGIALTSTNATTFQSASCTAYNR